MAMPSRKRLAWILLIGFIILFFTAVLWYLAPILFGETYVNEDGTTERRFSLFPSDGSGEGGSLLDIFNNDNTTETPTINQNVPDKVLPRLRRIAVGPVIGAHIFPTENNISAYSDEAEGKTLNVSNTENTIRYVELGTGHVYEGSTNNLDIRRISNTTIPRINEVMFVNPDRILIRYADEFDTIKTFSAEIITDFAQTSGVEKKLQGIFLEDDMTQISVSPEGKLLYLRPAQDGVNAVSAVVSDAIGGNRAQVFSSPLSEWRLSWQGRERIAMLTSTPSYNTYGLAFTLDTQTGGFAPYTSGRLALEVLANPSLTRSIISLNDGRQPKLFVWKKDSNQYIDLGLSGYAEKCVWAENRARFYCAVTINALGVTEPDLWYQGVTQNNDEIWEIDPETGQSLLIVIPGAYTTEVLDIIDISITTDERYLYFRNKATRSLWSYQLDIFGKDGLSDAQVGVTGDEEDFFE